MSNTRTHQLSYSETDRIFRCTCGTPYLAQDIDDAKTAHQAHELMVDDAANALKHSPAFAKLRETKEIVGAATPGPLEWVGNDLEQKYPGGGVIESEVSCGSYCYGGQVATSVAPGDMIFFEVAQVHAAAMVAALEAVLNLHTPEAGNSHVQLACTECSKTALTPIPWPCGTYSAAQGPLCDDPASQNS